MVRAKALARLMDLACLEMTIPDKPRSKNQKYRLTEKGRKALKGIKGVEATGNVTSKQAPEARQSQGHDEIHERGYDGVYDAAHDVAHDAAHDGVHDGVHEPLSEIELRILFACFDAPQNTPELLALLGYTSRTGNFRKALARLMDLACLEMTIPDKPRSKNQKYRLTEKGRKALKGIEGVEATGDVTFKQVPKSG